MVLHREGEDPLAVHLAQQHGVVAVVIAVAIMLAPRGGHRVLQRHVCARMLTPARRLAPMMGRASYAAL
jgi:hypothetical protein